MRIYIRTPLVNKSKMIPHTVEHCAGNVCWNVSDFFDFSRWLDWEISIDYTCFIPDKWVKYEDVLEKIFQPIEKKKVLNPHELEISFVGEYDDLVKYDLLELLEDDIWLKIVYLTQMQNILAKLMMNVLKNKIQMNPCLA